MNVPFLDLSRIHGPLEKKILEVTKNVLTKGDFILGNGVEKFERSYADYCETEYASAVSSGTDALELALRAYDIGEGDEVIIPANTFIATATAVYLSGAKPVLVDVGLDHNIDIEKIKDSITEKTKAIIPVHLYGQSAEMNSIMSLANQNNLKIIEDACQAHGARYNGRRVGSIGHAAAFSFYPGKNLGAAGDAGIVVSNDMDLVERVKHLRNYGQTEKYHHKEIAFNRRMDTLQAVFLDAKLPYLDEWNEQRRCAANNYDEGIKDFVERPIFNQSNEHVHHLYVIMASDTNERDALKNYLTERDIGTGIHYPIPIHMQEAFSHLDIPKGTFPMSEDYAERSLSLPIFPGITSEEVDFVSKSITEFYD